MIFEFQEKFLLAFPNFGSEIVLQWKLSLTFYTDTGAQGSWPWKIFDIFNAKFLAQKMDACNGE